MLQRIGPRQHECLSRATRCRELAQATADPKLREEYLKMERSWLRLADSYQSSERLNRFVVATDRTGRPD
jgi:hypothetical protein